MGKKSIYFKNERAHNLESLGGIRATLLEISSLKNYGKRFGLTPKNWASLPKKVATEKYRSAANNEI